MQNFMKYNFDIGSIEISCYVDRGGGAIVHKNRSSHGIIFYTGGISQIVFDDRKTLTACENDIVYLPKGSNYRLTDPKTQDGCYAINFQLYSDIVFEPFKFKTKNHKSFIALFQKAEQTWKRKESGFEMKNKAILYNILFELRKEYELGYICKETTALIKPAVDYILKEYPNDNIEVSFLADLCNMSETYFRRIFSKSFNISPLKYINNLKIDRAKELLSSGLYSVSYVAAASGFHDNAYFSRKFREATGLSPSEYK